MKQFLIIFLFTIIYLLNIESLKAQEKVTFDKKTVKIAAIKMSIEDSLFREINNTIYYTYYNPSYMTNKNAVFTMLKVDIDWKGKVTSVQFSDSADSTFVKAWLNKPKQHDDKATLEKYAKVKSYKNISLLIPVSFEPDYSPNGNKRFSYDNIETLLKFNKNNFTGESIIMPPIFISVLTKGNM